MSTSRLLSAAAAAAIFFSILPLITSKTPVHAPAPAPAPGPDCTDYVYNLVDCLDFVSGDPEVKVPTPECCSEFSSLLMNHPICLCKLINSNSSLSSDFNIDPTRASQIPDLCSMLGGSSPPSSPAAPSPAQSCDDAIYNLADCLDFVSGDPKVKRPSQVCCTEFSGLLKTQPACMCDLISSNSTDLGFNIDTARAAHMPKFCNIGIASPAPAPAPTVPLTPSLPEPPTTDGPSPALTCQDYVYNLADCLDFVSGDPSVTTPSEVCCSELKHLVNTKPVCLCKLINNSTDLGIVTFDVARAVAMPKLCNLDTPPIQACSLLGVPIDPTKYPPAPPAEGPDSPPTPPSPGGAARQHFTGFALISVLLTFFI